MARWTDLADWRGPTVNQGGAMTAHQGVVIHIAAGYFEGTISWQRKAGTDVSSHFVVGKDGRIAQVVDTDVTAWTQRSGNGKWLSVENEGFLPDPLTPAQIEANAKILARAHQEYGVPLVVTDTPDRRGLGHHSMGAENGYDWGHPSCPGPAIIGQKGAIVARAKELLNSSREAPDMDADQDNALAEDWAVGVALRDGGAAPKAGKHAGGKVWLVEQVKTLNSTVATLAASVRELTGRDLVDEPAIADAVLAGLRTRPVDDVAAAIRAVYGDRVDDLRRLGELLTGTNAQA